MEPPWPFLAKIDQILEQPDFPKFEAPRVEDQTKKRETFRGLPRPTSFDVKEVQNFGEIQLPRSSRPK